MRMMGQPEIGKNVLNKRSFNYTKITIAGAHKTAVLLEAIEKISITNLTVNQICSVTEVTVWSVGGAKVNFGKDYDVVDMHYAVKRDMRPFCYDQQSCHRLF